MLEIPVVSIITVCYNAEKTIAKTIESILGQSYKSYEYIIIDGKSTDGTLDIIKSYEPLFKGRLVIVSEKDHGIYEAMNKGIERASGQIIGIINSDDWYEAKALETVVRQFSNDFNKVVYGLTRMIENNEEKMLVTYNYRFLPNMMLTHPSCFVPKRVYESSGKFSLNYKYASDYDFMLRLYKKGLRFDQIDEVLANYIYGGETQRHSLVSRREALKVKHQYGYLSHFELYFSYLELSISVILRKIKRTFQKGMHIADVDYK